MLRIFLKLAVLICAVAVGRLAYTEGLELPVFSLKNVVVTGNSKISPDSIMAITGLEKGRSVYRQNLKYAASRLMRYPGVVACTVDRGYFSTITVDVMVAEPALLVNSGKLTALSREGVILPVDSKMPVLPLVSGRKFAFAQCYEHLRDPDITYALEAYDAIMAISPELSTRLSEINFQADDILRLFFSPAGTVIMIDKGDIENSIKRLAALIDSGMAGDTATFDLRFGPIIVQSSGETVL